MVLNYSLCLNRGKKMRLDPPFPNYPEYMNGRLKKIDMTARLNHIKNGLANKSWYPEWDARQIGPAQRILNNALDVLDEYDY